MKEYKKCKIPELRIEMKRRKIGYMSNWTKPVLIKRLEEEDRKGKYQPDEQLEHLNIMLTSLKLETSDLQKEFDDLSREQTKVLELNNVYARKKASIQKRILAIEANRIFVDNQKKSILDDLDPDW